VFQIKIFLANSGVIAHPNPHRDRAATPKLIWGALMSHYNTTRTIPPDLALLAQDSPVHPSEEIQRGQSEVG
jgi:hypothetical protein